MDAERQELRPHVRDEPLVTGATVTLRGGPDSIDKLRRHAMRTHRAFSLDGAPILGVSVFCALDDIGSASLRGLLSGRLVTYRWIHTPPERRLIDAGFTLLPTFGRPHFTVVLGSDSDDELGRLQRALGPRIENPYHQAGRIGR